MRRAVGFLGTLLLIALSFSLYTLVNAVKAQEKKLRDLDVAIARESENTRVLKADWSYLNQPERLQALARQHLTLVPTVARQIVILANLPEKSSAIDAAPAISSVDASQLPFRDAVLPPAPAPKIPAVDVPGRAAAVAAVPPVLTPPDKPAVMAKPPKVKPTAPKASPQRTSVPSKTNVNAIARRAAPAQGLP